MRRLTVCIGILVVCWVIGVQIILHAQQSAAFSAEARKLADDVLGSPYSTYLSTTGQTALEFISGRIPSAAGPREAAASFDSLIVDLFPRADAAPLGEVMVNNPDQDLRAAEDITTQSETAVAGFGRTIVVAFNDSGQYLANPSAPSLMGYSRSVDGGATFTDIGNMPSPQFGANFGDPGLVADLAGNFYASSLVYDPFQGSQAVGIYKSTNGGLTWPILAMPPPGTAGVADKPFIAVDTSSSRFSGNVYVSWTSFGAFGFPGLPILFSRSTNGGLTFSPPAFISPPGEVSQGSEPAVGPNGEVYVTWLRMAPLPRMVMMARSLDGGRSFSPATPVASLDNIGFATGVLNGNFRVLSWPRIDVSPANGNIYIVYASNPPGRDGADVFLVTSSDRGVTWSPPLRVNDDTTETDQFFPDIAVNTQGVVQVIWYDRRNDPDNLKIDVYRARISPNGRSVLRNEKVTSVSFPPSVGYDPLINRMYMGDYIDVKPILNANGRSVAFGAAWGDNRRRITTAGGRRNDQDVFFSRFPE